MKAQSLKVEGHSVRVHRYNTVIVGSGAAGMNCAVHLYEFFTQKGVKDAHDRIVVVTRGQKLGASRMSGSDKQTYYKMGTSPSTPDSAEAFSKSLTAAGCTHEDLALAEGIGSLREFYHLVECGVPFPHDTMGTYIGYKTDHDPYERATSAGPKTSKYMSECLQRQVDRYGIAIHDKQEVTLLLKDGARIAGVVTLDVSKPKGKFSLNVYLCENLVLAAGGPGELYKTSVYPFGQVGLHGLAFKAGLAAENFTESQFGLASTKFRWNVSGTYMQVVPRIFSTATDGKSDERDFLCGFFPSMSKMATDIFLKGYQWPFDPQRIEKHQSSLIDVLVFNETQRGRRVFMDFRANPVPGLTQKKFALGELEPEALDYLQKAGAVQKLPIERLDHMNPLAIDIYREHGIDLWKEPLEIAVCAQHQNGGLAVSKWWESSVPQTFVIGEMAGTHGVKRPGGSALNSGQTGGLRAATYIANVYGSSVPAGKSLPRTAQRQLEQLVKSLDGWCGSKSGLVPGQVIEEVQSRATAHGGHIRELASARTALAESVELYKRLASQGLKAGSVGDLVKAIQAEHLTLTSVALLRAIVAMLEQGAGSRGSHMVLAEDGVVIHPEVTDADGQPLRMKPENLEMRKSILRIQYDPGHGDLFSARNVPIRQAPANRKSFEPAWADYRQGTIFKD